MMLVGVRLVLRTELTERVEVQVAAEDALVELQGLPGVVAEADVGVQSRGHDVLLGSSWVRVPVSVQ